MPNITTNHAITYTNNILLKFAVPAIYYLLLDWYFLGVEMNFGHVAVNLLFQLIFGFPFFEIYYQTLSYIIIPRKNSKIKK